MAQAGAAEDAGLDRHAGLPGLPRDLAAQQGGRPAAGQGDFVEGAVRRGEEFLGLGPQHGQIEPRQGAGAPVRAGRQSLGLCRPGLRTAVGPAVRGEQRALTPGGLVQQPGLDAPGGLAHHPHHGRVALVAQTGEVEYGLDAPAERVTDRRARTGEGLQAVGEVLTTGDVDGAALGQRGADAVGAHDRFRGVETGSEPHLVEALAQPWVAPEPAHHPALPVAERDRHADVGEGRDQVVQDRVRGMQDAVVQRHVRAMGDQQPMRLQPRGAAPLPGLEHGVPDVRLGEGAGQETLMRIDEPADVVPGDGQRDHFLARSRAGRAPPVDRRPGEGLQAISP